MPVTSQIHNETAEIMAELLEQAALSSGDLLVVGCSTSEIAGGQIGKQGSATVAEAIFTALYPLLEEKGIYLAVQCCEHLNRALVVEETYARRERLTIVSAIPKAAAGGAFASFAWDQLTQPVLVEHVTAQAGIDIGGTLIGMHLAHVAVPIRLTRDCIGQAHILCAKTRPKYIGGARAAYE